MKTLRFIFILLLLIFIAPGLTNAQDLTGRGINGAGTSVNPSGNPTYPVSAPVAGSLTTPISSYQVNAPQGQPSGMLNNNLLITGNVGGGRFFHGFVPYGSPLDFRGSLDTTSLDSFLRYATPPSQDFYSPTASPLGYQASVPIELLAGPSTKIRTSTTSEAYFVPFSVSAASAQQVPSQSNLIPLPANIPGNYQTILSRVQGYQNVEQFIPNPGSLIETETSMKTVEQENLLKSELEQSPLNEPFKTFEQPAVTPATLKKTPVQPLQNLREEDYMQKRMQGNEQIRKAIEEQWVEKLKAAGVEETQPTAQKKKYSITTAPGAPAGPAAAAKVETNQGKQSFDFEKEYGDKFDSYIKTAQQYMKEGKFYQAADSYTMASIYRPLEPLGYAGKALALFAAGEYLSSSKMLSAAYDLNTEYAKTKLDLGLLFSDKSLLEVRLADLQKWTKASESPEFLFLLSFIDYQMGKNVQAEAAINLALQKKPEDKNMLALKKAIVLSREAK
jgi:hypothetical protein